MARLVALCLLAGVVAACWGTPTATPTALEPPGLATLPVPLATTAIPSSIPADVALALEPCDYLIWATDKAGSVQDALDAGQIESAAEIVREIERQPAPEEAAAFKDRLLQWLAVMREKASAPPEASLSTDVRAVAETLVNLEVEIRKVLELCPDWHDTPTP